MEPPDPIPNSEVKRCIADGSVGIPHVRVGHRQASKNEKTTQPGGFFLLGVCQVIPSPTMERSGVCAPDLSRYRPWADTTEVAPIAVQLSRPDTPLSQWTIIAR